MSLDFPQPAQPAPGATAHSRAFRHWQLGRQHAAQGHWAAAALAYVQASELHGEPAFALAAAHALLRSGRAAEAARQARNLRRRQPEILTIYTIEASALQEQGRFADALQCLRELPAQITPDRAFLITLARLLLQQRQCEEATQVLMQALALKIDDALSHYYLGCSFRERGMKAEAAECLRTALLLGMNDSALAARGQLVFMEREACRWRQADAELAVLCSELAALPTNVAYETSPFTHVAFVGDPIEQLQVARHYALHAARNVKQLPRLKARQRSGERLRVAYLSADFHAHATSQLLVQTLESHDRGSFEIFCLSTGPDDGSAMRFRMMSASEHFEDLRGWSHQRIAERVRKLGIHILIDLKGVTYDTLMPVLACRAAPLQVSWLGFPGTTGANYIDYVIGDPVVTPLEHQAHFSEMIAQLPRCYQPNDSQRPRARPTQRSEWGLSEEAVVLCAFHQAYKISEAVFDCWCSLLRERDDTVLWLLEWNANVQHSLRAAAATRGIDSKRLVFAPLLPLQQHLDRLAHADIFLDTWPCNAHTTAGEALWVGVPVVTLQGQTFAQRVASSLLHAVHLEQLVCGDQAGYHETVLGLVDDAPRRSALRAHLAAQRLTNPLFDGVRLARELEDLLQRMWQMKLRSERAQHLPARV